MRSRFRIAALAVLCVVGAHATHSDAQEKYPSRPVRLIVPYAPGGPADLAGRIVAQKLSDSLDQSVVIENRPGGGDVIANTQVAASAKDGHVLLLSTPILPLNTLLHPKLTYRISDFAPISQIVAQPYVLIAPPTLPATVREFIDYAKAHPGKLNFASPGPNSPVELLTRRFLTMNGLDVVAIHYSGAAPGERAVMTNEVQLQFSSPLTAIPLHRSGQVRILGLTSGHRLDSANDIPTLDEQGVPLVVESWYGILTRAGTPRPIIDLLNREIVKAVASDDYRNRIVASGGIPRSSTPDEFRQLIARTEEEYRGIIRDAGTKTDAQ